jgi:hypothetical protein
MTDMTIHFISKDTLKLQGAQEEKTHNNILWVTDKFGDKYIVNLEKVLYILVEESEE